MKNALQDIYAQIETIRQMHKFSKDKNKDANINKRLKDVNRDVHKLIIQLIKEMKYDSSKNIGENDN